MPCVKSFFFFIHFVIVLPSAWAETGGWQYDWSDEFDRTGSPIIADTWKWDGGTSMVRGAQLDEANGYCQNGLLILEGKRVGSGNQYTSAAISSIGLKSWKYGRFEMRARIDARKGSWPAWWTTGVSGGWPAGGEIDMLEYYTDQVLFNVMDGAQRWTSPRLSTNSLGGAEWSSQFHSWIMEWDSTRIDLSLDGNLVNHYSVSMADGTGPNGINPFRQPHNMRLNLAIGATGGDPTGTQFPILFEVDYIRHWNWVNSVDFNVAIDGGSGSGQYLPGSLVSIAARMPPPGKIFDKWVMTSVQGNLSNINTAATTFIMPSGNVSLSATYKGASSAVHEQRTFTLQTKSPMNYGLFLRYNLAGRVVGQGSTGIDFETSRSAFEGFVIRGKDESYP